MVVHDCRPCTREVETGGTVETYVVTWQQTGRTIDSLSQNLEKLNLKQ